MCSMRVLALPTFLVGSLAGCGAVGSTVNQVYANQVSISFEYTHWYPNERTFAMQKADEHCNRFGKHAQLAGDKRIILDRSTMNFNYVAP
jgi:hypothetical protein